MTVVDILGTVSTRPAVDADAGVAADRISASGAVVTDARSNAALVHVDFAQFAGVGGRASAPVPIDVVDAGSAVLAQMSGTVVDIFLAVFTSET